MKLKSLICNLAAAALLTAPACSPDEYSLGDVSIKSENLVEGFSFSIEHDADNPNIVYLKSLMGSQYQALWEHPQGRDQGEEVTLKMPFAGTYDVVFGVMTSAGPVYGDTAQFTIDDFYANFVTDELWTNISGGVGNSKKWYLDLDESGVSRYFSGPLSFFGTDDTWETVTLGEESSGDSWCWNADWASVAGWGFVSTAMDFGYMEFSLDGGANVTVVNNAAGTTTTGTYMLDTDNHTITFTDTEMLRDGMYDGSVETWARNLRILSLTETTMQIAVLRTSDACLLSYNFISEDAYNNYSPSVSTTITLDDDWRDYVEPKTSKEMIFALDEDQPFDWCTLDGEFYNITSIAAIEDVADMKITFYSGNYSYTISTPDGAEYTGTYTLSDKGLYTFSDAVSAVNLSDDGEAYFAFSEGNELQILKYELDDYTGGLSDLWIGCKQYDALGEAYQYIAYHFVVQTSGSESVNYSADLHIFEQTNWNTAASSTLYIQGDGSYTFTIEESGWSSFSDGIFGIYLDMYKVLKKYPNMDMEITSIKVDGSETTFDDTAISRGAGDGSSDARRYILNPWNDESAATTSNFLFSEKLEVTIKVTLETGTPFISED